MTSNSNNVIRWIQGNELVLAIPLQKVTVTPDGKVSEPYYPTEDESIKVILNNNSAYWKSTEYTPTIIDGNVIKITDYGELGIGIYNVTILITSDNHSPRRSKWNHIVEIYDSNDSVLDAFDDFPDYGSGEVIDAAVFYFAKGDKGDQGPQGEQGPVGPSGGMLFPTMEFNPETGILAVRGLQQEVQRIGYDEATAELIIRL